MTTGENQKLEPGLKRLLRRSSFRRLRSRSNRFRAMDAFGIRSRETSHSNFLAFLLDPSASHGMKERLLADFLALASDAESYGSRTDNRLSLTNQLKVDPSKVRVYRERHNIDVLIDCLPEGPVIGIELKIWAQEQPDQINRYQKALSLHYPNRPAVLVFLTPAGSDPETGDPDHGVPTVPLSWGMISELVDDAVESGVNDEAEPFIREFSRNVREFSMVDQEEQKLLQTLFRDPEMARLFRRIEKAKPKLQDQSVSVPLIERSKQEISRATGICESRIHAATIGSGDPFTIYLSVDDWDDRGFPVRLAFYHQPSWPPNESPGFNVVIPARELDSDDGLNRLMEIIRDKPDLCNSLEFLSGWDKKYQVIQDPPDGKEDGWIIPNESFDDQWIENAVKLLSEQVQFIKTVLSECNGAEGD